MNTSNNGNNSLYGFSDLLQIINLLILANDFNNTDLMKYLVHQDELLDTIIKQNQQIIDLLKKDNEEEIDKN